MTEPLKQMRRLTQALVVSGGLNIRFLALLLYGVLGDGFLRWRNDMLIHRWPRTDQVVMDTVSKEEAIAQILVMPFDELVNALSSHRRLDESLAERDVALGQLLVSIISICRKLSLKRNCLFPNRSTCMAYRCLSILASRTSSFPGSSDLPRSRSGL